MQTIIIASEDYAELDEYFLRHRIRKIFLICGNSIKFLHIGKYFEDLENRKGIKVVRFSDFHPNPCYESVVEGVKAFRAANCNFIVAVGGGSAIDVAKCIKLYSGMNDNENFLKQPIHPNNVNLLAVPTTAGTGSEATRYAVIYYKGEKQSVTDNGCIPSTILFDAGALRNLPLYHRKSAMMDAFCHAVESFWSINSTDESKEYSRKAINLIMRYKDLYINNEDEGNKNMLKASYIAGKAINITQTTAGHAMCYKLTSLYGIAHGHAAALCNVKLFLYNIKHMDQCVDRRGSTYLSLVMDDIAESMGCKNQYDAAKKFEDIVLDLNFETLKKVSYSDIEKLVKSVNQERLKNHPVRISEEAIKYIYRKILAESGENNGK